MLIAIIPKEINNQGKWRFATFVSALIKRIDASIRDGAARAIISKYLIFDSFGKLDSNEKLREEKGMRYLREFEVNKCLSTTPPSMPINTLKPGFVRT